jgi:hypothetical protein
MSQTFYAMHIIPELVYLESTTVSQTHVKITSVCSLIIVHGHQT